MVQQLMTANLAIIIASAAVGSIFCLARLCSRLLSVKGTWKGLMMWSDLCILVAWVWNFVNSGSFFGTDTEIGFSMIETVSMCEVTILAHFGYHELDAMKMNTDHVLLSKWMLVNEVAYNPILAFVKASMILLYLRLGGAKEGARKACCAMLAFNISCATSNFVACFLQCLPFEYQWNSLAMDAAAQAAAGATDPGIGPYGPVPTGFKDGKYVAGGTCFQRVDFIMIIAGLSILTDVLILCIPIYMVYDLRMKPKKKAVVLLILCLGLAVTAASVTRLQFQWAAFHPTDPDANYSVRCTISKIETGLALVTGCVPDLFPMLRRCCPNFLRDDTDILEPNPYPVGSGSDSSYSYRMKKVLGPLTPTIGSRKISNVGGERDDGYDMNTFNWRGDELQTGEITVKGGASNSSLHGSEEAIIEEAKNAGIVKTTHFVVQETEHRLEEKRWSNI